jgi:hypothetical protein
MPAIFTIPEATYPIGLFVSPEVALADNITRIGITLTRIAWPGAGSLVVDLFAEVSLDGGANWIFIGGGSDVGGDLLDPRGFPRVTNFLITCPVGVGRKLRGKVTTNVILRTTITLVAE